MHKLHNQNKKSRRLSDTKVSKGCLGLQNNEVNFLNKIKLKIIMVLPLTKENKRLVKKQIIRFVRLFACFLSVEAVHQIF